MRPLRALLTLVTAAALVLGLAACVGLGPERPTTAGTFTFAVSSPPTGFDPFYASDADTFRITRQIFETLISVRTGSTHTEPGLATRWESDPSGRVWTFHLRAGVTFSDGTPFSATSVCANLNRMFDQPAARQAAAAYWRTFFGGFKTDTAKDASLYRSCTADDATTAVVTIAHPTGRFPAMLSEPAFAMQSPLALSDADAAPVGSGPYELKSYDPAKGRVVLGRNPRYRGVPARTPRLVFTVIPDASKRRQALEAGRIDGYDLPDPLDWAGLKAEGDQLEVREPVDLLYLGFSFGHNKLLDDLRVRKALYHALDRERLLKAVLPDGAEPATQFVPKSVSGYDASLQPYPYDPALARKELAAAHATKLHLTFGYPSDVSRPYLPDPAAVFDSLRTDLEAVGVKVTVVEAPWVRYEQDVSAGRYDAYLDGWTGDLDDAYASLGMLFADPARNPFHTAKAPWGTKLAAALQSTDSTLDPAVRRTRLAALSAQIMTKDLPGLPISSSPSAMVLGPTVRGLVASPLDAESFASVTAAAPVSGT